MTSTASWTLVPPAATPGAVLTPPIAPTPENPSFLGNGLLRPFRRDEKQDFANGGGVLLVVSAVGQILGTRAASEANQGELQWRPEFGSLVHLLKHRNNNAILRELARTTSMEALDRWEPRANITGFGTNTKKSSGETRDDILELVFRIGVVQENAGGNDVLVQEIDKVFTFTP